MDSRKTTFVLGIAGGTASGKTTLVNLLKDHFKDRISLISHDYYYYAFDDKSLEERKKLNYDHPDSFETEKLISDIKSLKNGKTVELPIYDYALHTRSRKTLVVEPKPVTVVEGILIFQKKKLRKLMDLRVFIDADADERLVRRVTRDTIERGRDINGVLSQYVNIVKPMHNKFVEPSKKHAHIIIPDGGHNKKALKILIQHIEKILEGK